MRRTPGALPRDPRPRRVRARAHRAPTPEPFAMASLGADESSDRVRDSLWQPGGASGGLAYLALAGPEDSDEGKLFVGTAGADDGVDIADRVVAVAMAPPPRRRSRRRSIPGAAWATAAGDVVYAKLKDRASPRRCEASRSGRSTTATARRRWTWRDSRLARGPGLALIVAAREREDPDRHHVLVLDAGTPEVSNFWDVVSPPPAPSCTRLEGTFDIDDDETVGLRGPYLHGLTVRQWGVALASHRKAWDNQLCALEVAGAGAGPGRCRSTTTGACPRFRSRARTRIATLSPGWRRITAGAGAGCRTRRTSLDRRCRRGRPCWSRRRITGSR